jgi:hypothetical protein
MCQSSAERLSNPAPFSAQVEGRTKHRLGDHFGLANFGINRTELEPGYRSTQQPACLFLANSELPSFPSTRSGRIVAILRFFRFSNAATKLNPGYSKANVLVRRAEALLNPIRLPDALQQSFMPLLAFDRVRDNAAAIDMT